MKIVNRRAFYDYKILEKFEAGINLMGAEVKSVKGGHADLTGSFVRIIGSEAYLVNAKIFPLKYARLERYDERRTRKLLLHKKETISLKSKTEGSNLTIIPVSLYLKDRLIKVKVALAIGKKKFDKREEIKRKDSQREIEIELRAQGGDVR